MIQSTRDPSKASAPAPAPQFKPEDLFCSDSDRKVDVVLTVIDTFGEVRTVVQHCTIEKSAVGPAWEAFLQSCDSHQTSTGKPGRPAKHRCIVAAFDRSAEGEYGIPSDSRPEIGEVCTLKEAAELFDRRDPITMEGIKYHMRTSGVFTKNGWTFLDFKKFLAKPDDALSNAHVKWCEENGQEPFK